MLVMGQSTPNEAAGYSTRDEGRLARPAALAHSVALNREDHKRNMAGAISSSDILIHHPPLPHISYFAAGLGLAWRGGAWRGMAWLGRAGRGKAWQGKVEFEVFA